MREASHRVRKDSQYIAEAKALECHTLRAHSARFVFSTSFGTMTGSGPADRHTSMPAAASVAALKQHAGARAPKGHSFKQTCPLRDGRCLIELDNICSPLLTASRSVHAPAVTLRATTGGRRAHTDERRQLCMQQARTLSSPVSASAAIVHDGKVLYRVARRISTEAQTDLRYESTLCSQLHVLE